MEYGLIGGKLGHSHSPRIHQLLKGYDYCLRELTEEELPAFLAARDFKGLNVTIPYKQAVLPYCAALGHAAQRIGCVNTIVKRADGTLFGDNTDYEGFLYTLRRRGIELKDRHVLVLGTGGTSLTVTAAAEDQGAASVTRVSRRGEVNYENIYDLQETEIIVNTTPAGMYPNNGKALVELSRFSRLRGVADVVYNPLITALRFQAEALGIPNAGGLPMLAAQARGAAERFTGEKISNEKLEEVCRTVAADVTNVVLIGMPGSGKTSVGKLTAKLLDRPFLDSDVVIEERAGCTIPELFEREGEEAFRKLETEVLSDLGKRSGVVIATGGGAVLRQENLPLLRQNGRIVRLRRPVELLPREGRPLSSSPERLRAMEAEREPYYSAAAEWTVDNTASPEEAAAALVAEFRRRGGIL